jgi:hypothetical protein
MNSVPNTPQKKLLGALKRLRSLWTWFGLAAVTGVMLTDLSRLLGDIQVPGRLAYDASVFTNPHIVFFKSRALEDAMSVWTQAAANCGTQCTVTARDLIALHVGIDVFFAFFYCVLLGRLLVHLQIEEKRRNTLIGAVFLADQFENILTFFFVRPLSAGAVALGFVQFFTLLKWAALIFIAITIVLKLRSGGVPGPNLPVRRLTSLMILVGVWIAIAALPAGGPLEQLPDVVRAAIESGAIALSTVGVFLFAFAVRTAGWLSLRVPAGDQKENVRTRLVLIIAACVSVLIFALDYFVAKTGGLAPFALLFVVAALPLVSWLLAKFRDLPAGNTSAATASDDAATKRWTHALAALVLIAGGLSLVRASFPPLVLGLDHPGIPWPWLIFGGSALAVFAGLLVESAVGFVRKKASTASGETPKWQLVFHGLVVLLTVIAVLALLIFPGAAVAVGSLGVISICFAGIAVLLGALRIASAYFRWIPKDAFWGKRPVSWVAVISLTWVVASYLNTEGYYHDVRVDARPTTPPRAGFEPRHADLTAAFEKWKAVQADCLKATDQPAPASASSSASALAAVPVPMVIVAAAGGGIRAGYWTAAALDGLFKPVAASTPGRETRTSAVIAAAGPNAPSAAELDAAERDAAERERNAECVRARLFAVSSASGGSVGAATYIATIASAANDASDGMGGDGGADASDGKNGSSDGSDDDSDDNGPKGQMTLLSEDRALAAGLKGLLLNDLVQPLVGLRWPDRAALIEDGWTHKSVFSEDGAYWWSGLGADETWTPVLVMNSSSVLDGCRILVSNVGALPFGVNGDCGAPTNPKVTLSRGPVTRAIDPFVALVSRAGKRLPPCNGDPPNQTVRTADMRTVTAMLLSARFTYVTPSGALIRCVESADKHDAVYAVDGGYYENSGIFTLLQMWNELAPRVSEHNATSSFDIAPWIVVIDNAYRATASTGEADRPREIFAPLLAWGNKKHMMSQPALEQMAAAALRSPPAQPCTIVVTPRKSPSVAAPLGWVLSEVTRTDLDKQLEKEMTGEPLQRLKAQIQRTADARTECIP